MAVGASVGLAPPARADWAALGTTVSLAVTEPARLAAARVLLHADLEALDAACSRFRADSELARVDAAGGAPVRVSALLAAAVGAALDAARLTDGDVDPTVGSAMTEIGYDRDFRLLPADAAPVVRVRTVPGWRQVELDRSRRMLRLPPGVRLDLGATAKAFAADRSAQRIARLLHGGVLVSLGGDVAVAGDPPPGGWTVRVQDLPGRAEDPVVGPTSTVSIRSGGLATSSTAARRWRRGGEWMHHVVDPRTGLPARTPWRTVTVAAATCLQANTASTAAVVRGADAPRWLSALGLPARLVRDDGSVLVVGGWPGEDAR